MKKLIAVVAWIALALSVSACVPDKQSSMEIAPDMTPKENVQFDFVQLHNDTLELFEGYDVYSYVTDLDITGSNDDRMIYVKAVCLDDVTEDVVSYFASAVLHRINDAAVTQDRTVEESTSADFGSMWDKFGCEIRIYTDTEAANENGTPLLSVDHKAGEDDFALDPDIGTYESEFDRQVEILERNEE